MMSPKSFRLIATAPRDGTVIEVRHGPRQDIVPAVWTGETGTWARTDADAIDKLHNVRVWRPMAA